MMLPLTGPYRKHRPSITGSPPVFGTPYDPNLNRSYTNPNGTGSFTVHQLVSLDGEDSNDASHGSSDGQVAIEMEAEVINYSVDGMDIESIISYKQKSTSSTPLPEPTSTITPFNDGTPLGKFEDEDGKLELETMEYAAQYARRENMVRNKRERERINERRRGIFDLITRKKLNERFCGYPLIEGRSTLKSAMYDCLDDSLLRKCMELSPEDADSTIIDGTFHHGLELKKAYDHMYLVISDKVQNRFEVNLLRDISDYLGPQQIVILFTYEDVVKNGWDGITLCFNMNATSLDEIVSDLWKIFQRGHKTEISRGIFNEHDEIYYYTNSKVSKLLTLPFNLELGEYEIGGTFKIGLALEQCQSNTKYIKRENGHRYWTVSREPGSVFIRWDISTKKIKNAKKQTPSQTISIVSVGQWKAEAMIWDLNNTQPHPRGAVMRPQCEWGNRRKRFVICQENSRNSKQRVLIEFLSHKTTGDEMTITDLRRLPDPIPVSVKFVTDWNGDIHFWNQQKKAAVLIPVLSTTNRHIHNRAQDCKLCGIGHPRLTNNKNGDRCNFVCADMGKFIHDICTKLTNWNRNISILPEILHNERIICHFINRTYPNKQRVKFKEFTEDLGYYLTKRKDAFSSIYERHRQNTWDNICIMVDLSDYTIEALNYFPESRWNLRAFRERMPISNHMKAPCADLIWEIFAKEGKSRGWEDAPLPARSLLVSMDDIDRERLANQVGVYDSSEDESENNYEGTPPDQRERLTIYNPIYIIKGERNMHQYEFNGH